MSRPKTASHSIILAYMQLLKEMPMEKITISLLLKRAFISRSTFYYNFSSLNDVLNAVMEFYLELIHETMNFKECCFIWDYRTDSYVYSQTLKVAQRVYEEKEVFSALLHSPLRQVFLEQFANAIIDGYRSIAHLRDGAQISLSERRYFDYTAAYNTVGSYLCWHDGGFAETPEEFVRLSFLMSHDESIRVAPL